MENQPSPKRSKKEQDEVQLLKERRSHVGKIKKINRRNPSFIEAVRVLEDWKNGISTVAACAITEKGMELARTVVFFQSLAEIEEDQSSKKTLPRQLQPPVLCGNANDIQDAGFTCQKSAEDQASPSPSTFGTVDIFISFVQKTEEIDSWVDEKIDVELRRSWWSLSTSDLSLLSDYQEQLRQEMDLKRDSYNHQYLTLATVLTKKPSESGTIETCIQGIREKWCWLTKLTTCCGVHVSDALNRSLFLEEAAAAKNWVLEQLDKIQNPVDQIVSSEEEGDVLKKLEERQEEILEHHSNVWTPLIERFFSISPLWKRGEMISFPVEVSAICDYESSITAGDVFTLHGNSGLFNWAVRNKSGVEISAPAAIFRITSLDDKINASISRTSRQLDHLRSICDKKQKMITRNQNQSMTIEEKDDWRKKSQILFDNMQVKKQRHPKHTLDCSTIVSTPDRVSDDDCLDFDLFDTDVNLNDLWSVSFPPRSGHQRIIIINDTGSRFKDQIRSLIGNHPYRERSFILPTIRQNKITFLEYEGKSEPIESLISLQSWNLLFNIPTLDTDAPFIFEAMNIGQMFQLVLINIHCTKVRRDPLNPDWRTELEGFEALNAYGHPETRDIFNAFINDEARKEFERVMVNVGFGERRRQLYLANVEGRENERRMRERHERMSRKREIEDAKMRGRREYREMCHQQDLLKTDDTFDDEDDDEDVLE